MYVDVHIDSTSCSNWFCAQLSGRAIANEVVGAPRRKYFTGSPIRIFHCRGFPLHPWTPQSRPILGHRRVAPNSTLPLKKSTPNLNLNSSNVSEVLTREVPSTALWYVHVIAAIPTDGVEMTEDDEIAIEKYAKVFCCLLVVAPRYIYTFEYYSLFQCTLR